MTGALVFVTAMAAFAMFAASTDRHRRRIVPARVAPVSPSSLRHGGVAALVLSFAVAIAASGAGGLVVWFAAIMPAAAAVFLAVNLSSG